MEALEAALEAQALGASEVGRVREGSLCPSGTKYKFGLPRLPVT